MHYLFATNLDPRGRIDSNVRLSGRFGEVVDLCVEGGAIVPVERDAQGMRIPLVLDAGKGVVFRIDPAGEP